MGRARNSLRKKSAQMEVLWSHLAANIPLNLAVPGNPPEAQGPEIPNAIKLRASS